MRNYLQVGGTSGGDAKSIFAIPGGQVWSFGLDNSQGDNFKISNHTNLGTKDRIAITPSGDVGIGVSNPVHDLKDRGIDNQAIRDLAEKLASAVPDGDTFETMRADLERNFRGLLTGAFERLDLVTREEFDVQRKVLERTREKLGALESELQRLEERLAEPDSD